MPQTNPNESPKTETDAKTETVTTDTPTQTEKVEELGGPKGPEPTRFGDWEKGGRCSDF